MDPAETGVGAPPARRRFTVARVLAGYAMGALCLVWLFHDVHPSQVLRSAGNIRWDWVAGAVAFDVLSYVSQGWRWQALLRPSGRVGTLEATQAIYAGLFANELLPMRPGEALRAWLVSRRMSLPLTRVLPSIAVERFLDGLWLAIGIGLSTLFMPLPRRLAQAADALGIAVLLGAGVLLALVLRRGEETQPPARSGLRGFLSTIQEEMRKIARSRSFRVAFAASGLLLLGQILAFWMILIACRLPASFWMGAVVLFVVHLGTALPNAPANLGTYQAAVVLGLSLFGIEKDTATAFSFVVFFILTVPLWVLGMLAASRSGLRITPDAA